MNTNYN